MAISEQSRHNLHPKLEAVLGADEAATLMEHLPPVGWGDVATKADLVLMRRDLDVLRLEFKADLHSNMTSQTRTLVLTVIASNLTMAAATLAAVVLR